MNADSFFSDNFQFTNDNIMKVINNFYFILTFYLSSFIASIDSKSISLFTSKNEHNLH